MQNLAGAVEALRALPDAFSFHADSSLTGFTQSFGNEAAPPPAAHRVEQGGIGFSADQVIGTEHVANCVGIIVRDPLTRRTALAHYDDTSTPESLSRIFDVMPRGRTLDVVLIGAKYGPETEDRDYERDSSQKNLHHVLTSLAGRDINIIGARIHDPRQPHAFSVDPSGFFVRENENLIPNPLSQYAFARKFLGNGGPQPMAVEFDFQESAERYPYYLGEEQRKNLDTRVRGCSGEEVAEWFRGKGARGGFEYRMAELSRGYLLAYDSGGAFTSEESRPSVREDAFPAPCNITPSL